MSTRIACIGLAVAAVSPLPALGTVLYATDFESPAYAVGALAAQDGWFAALGADAATVSTESASSPTQSVRIDGSMLESFFGFHFGSYARPLNFDPLAAGLPVVTLTGMVNLTGAIPPTCGTGLGLTGVGDALPNALIGIQADGNGRLAPYLSNADSSTVLGPDYTSGQWAELTAVFDYRMRTITGFVDGFLMGVVPFTTGAGSQIAFVNMSLGSSVPVPGVVAYNDDYRLTAAPAADVSEPPALDLGALVVLGVALHSGRRRRCAPQLRVSAVTPAVGGGTTDPRG